MSIKFLYLWSFVVYRLLFRLIINMMINKVYYSGTLLKHSDKYISVINHSLGDEIVDINPKY